MKKEEGVEPIVTSNEEDQEVKPRTTKIGGHSSNSNIVNGILTEGLILVEELLEALQNMLMTALGHQEASEGDEAIPGILRSLQSPINYASTDNFKRVLESVIDLESLLNSQSLTWTSLRI